MTYIETTKTNETFHTLLNTHAVSLHQANIATLTVREGDEAALRPLQIELAAVESTLTVLSGARLFSGSILTTLSDEIDQVLRYLKHRVITTVPSLQSHREPVAAADHRGARAVPTRPRRLRPNIPKNDMSSDAVLVYSELSDRTTRIKTVLEAKPEATIKDLTDIITDVSAKTIQRDLNSLIDQGVVIRQGERRWSKYSLA